MTVRTTYFSALSNGDVDPATDTKVYAVVRYPQDWITDLVDRNIPALAPPERLLDPYKTVEEAAEARNESEPSKIAWESVSFAERYREYLRTQASEVLETVGREAMQSVVWLVCWEADDQYCHRRLLAEELDRHSGVRSVGFAGGGIGRECPECEAGCVCSVREFEQVFRLAATQESDAKRALESDAEYICSNCFAGFDGGVGA